MLHAHLIVDYPARRYRLNRGGIWTVFTMKHPNVAQDVAGVMQRRGVTVEFIHHGQPSPRKAAKSTYVKQVIPAQHNGRDVLTIAQAVARTGLPYSNVFRYARDGHWDAVQLGARWLIYADQPLDRRNPPLELSPDRTQKTCPHCGETKPATEEYFYRGHRRCKPCLSAIIRQRKRAQRAKDTAS
jgi:hypothetical protein